MGSFNQPLGGNEMARFGGPATMMRLPSQTTAEGLDACFVGIPMDTVPAFRSMREKYYEVGAQIAHLPIAPA